MNRLSQNNKLQSRNGRNEEIFAPSWYYEIHDHCGIPIRIHDVQSCDVTRCIGVGTNDGVEAWAGYVLSEDESGYGVKVVGCHNLNKEELRTHLGLLAHFCWRNWNPWAKLDWYATTNVNLQNFSWTVAFKIHTEGQTPFLMGGKRLLLIWLHWSKE